MINMQSRYFATIVGYDISRGIEIDVGDDFEAAMDLADQQLGDGFLHHTIVIYDRQKNSFKEGYLEGVAHKSLNQDEWILDD